MINNWIISSLGSIGKMQMPNVILFNVDKIFANVIKIGYENSENHNKKKNILLKWHIYASGRDDFK